MIDVVLYFERIKRILKNVKPYDIFISLRAPKNGVYAKFLKYKIENFYYA